MPSRLRHPEWALAAAKRLETIAAACGHLVHMPSHIYMLVGDDKAAADARDFESAFELLQDDEHARELWHRQRVKIPALSPS